MIVVCTLGIPEGLTYFIARGGGIVDRRQLWAALSVACGTGLIGVAVLYLLTDLLSGGSETIGHLIESTSWALIPTLCNAVLRGVASGLQLWHLVGIERSVSALVRASLLIGFAVIGILDVKEASLIIAYSQGIGGLVYIGLLRGRRWGRSAKVSSLVNFGLRTWMGTVAGIVLMRLDQVLITPLSNVRELGLYVIAVSAAEIPIIVNTALKEIIYASDAEQRDDNRIALASRISTCGVIAIALPIAISAPFAFPIIFGPDFEGAVVPCLILLVGVVIGNPASIVAAALSARGHPGMRSAALAAAAVVNCVLVFILVPRFGATGAACATLAGNVVSSVFALVVYRFKYSASFSAFYRLQRSDIRYIRILIQEAAGKLSRMKN